MLRQTRHKAKLPGLAQAFGRDSAAGSNQHRRRGAGSAAARDRHRPPFEPYIAAEHLRLPRNDGKIGFRKIDTAPSARQFRCIGCHLNVVASERHAALHFGLVQVDNRQRQLEFVVGAGAGHRARQGIGGHHRQRRAIDNPQSLGQGATGLGVDGHHRAIQVGNGCFHLADLQTGAGANSGARTPDLHLGALKNQFAAELGQRWPGQRVARLQAARHVGVAGVVDIGCNPEFTALGVAKRHIAQIPFDLELDPAGSAGLDRVAHVVTHRAFNDRGQVAVHAGSIGTAEASLQIEHARKPGMCRRFSRVTGFPLDLRLALRVGIAELQIGHLNGDLLAIDLPARVKRQLADSNHRLVKNGWQSQGAAGNTDSRPPARLVEVKLDAGTLDAWKTGGRRQFELTDQALDVELAQILHRALPTRLQSFDQAARRMRQQGGAGHRIERQAIRNLRQGTQIEPVGLDLTARRHLAFRAQVIHADIATRPMQAVARIELQGLRREFKTGGQQLAGKTAAHRLQFQRLQVLAQRHADFAQGNVRRRAHQFATRDIKPRRQRTVAPAQIDADFSIAPQFREVDPGEFGVQLPFPVLPAPFAA